MSTISTCKTKNFNQKYFVIWFNIKFYGDDDDDDNHHQRRHRNNDDDRRRKLGVLWIQSWRHRYLKIGFVQSNSIGARIGLKHGDRLGYWNGTVAPKIKDIEKFFSKSSSTTTEDFTCTLRLGILRKHDPIMANLLQLKSDLNCSQHLIADNDDNEKVNCDDVNDDHVKHFNQKDDNNQKNLRYFFVAQSCYENLKEPELYDDGKSTSINNNLNNNCSNCYSINSLIISFSPTQQSTPIIDRIDCSQNDLQEAGSTFIKNKENHQPIFIDKKSNVGTLNETYTKNGKCEQKKCPELEKMLKTYELVSYEKKLYHKYPDTMIKPKIDKHIKSQRALRNVQNQN
ncbi:uncharacterized protein LOC124494705 [Dermatophagoides farinae]|uniref:uncharacterized protein LOC124494705 n=1 Tax=Dermatophagoides farinae TaxID=6954 RepID=UPI003F61C48E